MALTKIDICNQALLKVGADPISSLDTNANTSEPVILNAKLCKIFFDQSLREVIREHNWNCVTKRARLSRDTEAPAFKWKYKYLLPNDNERVINVYDSSEGENSKTEWAVEGNYIVCDYEQVYIIYSYAPQDLSILDAFVAKAVIQNLAVKIAVPLQLDQTMQNNLIEEYTNIILPSAKSTDTLENRYWKMEESDWIQSIYNTSPII
jgi:hypothetical protein